MESFGELVLSESDLRAVIPSPPSARRRCARRSTISTSTAATSSPVLRCSMLATADAVGRCDVSPRGGPPGFARVLDPGRLLAPDFPGNRRLDSQQNLLGNPSLACCS